MRLRRTRITKPIAYVLLPLAGAAATLWGTAGRIDAAASKGRIEAVFGTLSASASTSERFFVSLRNAGTGDATLGLGDSFTVRFTTGTATTDLTTEPGALTAVNLAAGITQTVDGGEPDRTGTKFTLSAPVTLAPGADLLIELTGTTGAAGVAPVAVDLALAKTAGKFAKRTEFRVVKSPVAGEFLFGDGSDGALVVTSDAALEPLRNYTDVRIAAGVTVSVPSGTTIRCTGTFENRGTIRVGAGGEGGGALVDEAGTTGVYALVQELSPAQIEIGVGDAAAAPSRPAVMALQAVTGARGGRGLGTAVHGLPLSSYRRGGGGGSGAFGAIGGSGGGLLRIVARGELRNGGTITAAGAAPTANRTTSVVGGGAGGGGGGIVILASAFRVANDVVANGNGAAATGTIDVRGGNAGPLDLRGGQGGAGGGGLVVFCAPEVGAFGTTQLSAGIRDISVANLPGSVEVWSGGGGGGASAGDGGDGAGVAADGKINQSGAAPAVPTDGQLVVRTSDPRGLW